MHLQCDVYTVIFCFHQLLLVKCKKQRLKYSPGILLNNLRELFDSSRPHGPMDKALAYGARDSGFDPQCGRF